MHNVIYEEYLPSALLYGVPYDLFWSLNPKKLTPFRIAYQKKIDMDAYARWEMGRLINMAVWNIKNYPKNPLVGENEDENIGSTESAAITAKKFDAWAKLFNEGFENRKEQKGDS